MGLTEKYHSDCVILTKADALIHWAQKSSLWPLTFGLACCALEFMSVFDPLYDLNRFGVLPVAASPRQADLMFVLGTITKKMAPAVELLYQQMPEPKWVIAVGACAIGGGPFADSYNVVPGADLFLPVDVYIPGCPPRPEQFIVGVMRLQDLISGKVLPPDGDADGR